MTRLTFPWICLPVVVSLLFLLLSPVAPVAWKSQRSKAMPRSGSVPPASKQAKAQTPLARFRTTPATAPSATTAATSARATIHTKGHCEKKPLNKSKIAILTALGISSSYLVYSHRQQLFDKHFLQDKTLELLQGANENKFGILYYILGMAAWETIGLSTIPVETAAGIAFGMKRAVMASLTGKLLGAATAFLLGRYVLQHWVRRQLETNDNFQLIEASVAQKPLSTAILLKYSCFPEFVKNFGTALLQPIPLWGFLVATTLHGGPFTCLWSWLGADTALRLKSPDLPANRALQTTLVVAMTVGLVLSPAAMALWIKDLRKDYKHTVSTPATR
jgi:uncharacterized membrane protein YdjX (TVP38/TMEM64 family)